MKLSGLYIFLLSVFLVSFGSWVLYPTGSPGGKTGSPGDGGATCTQCHTGTAQQAQGWITTNIPAEGYTPGQTYSITATGTHSGVVKFGFEATAENFSGVKKGTLVITDAVQTQLANLSKSVTHTVNGNTPFGSTKSWSFNWTAPEEGSGPIIFYGAFNAANGNGTTSGDVIYVTQTTVSENTGVGIAEDLLRDSGLKAFPNPATDFTHITWDNDHFSLNEVKLYNLEGRQVGNYFMTEKQSGNFRLDLSSVHPGMYFAVASFSNGRQATLSLVKR